MRLRKNPFRSSAAPFCFDFCLRSCDLKFKSKERGSIAAPWGWAASRLSWEIDDLISKQSVNRQEALLAAISEKDANIALLELSASKKKKTQEEVMALKREKDRLVHQLKQQVGPPARQVCFAGFGPLGAF
ncbi:ERC protein 2 [Myotis davidii]|uniref:ERC protein 2 n=1 Tax=Myotis davidii TaxID=225400 RepID=L5MFI6_MYODS|nr:ERC protein 2 [Myotis davidii]